MSLIKQSLRAVLASLRSGLKLDLRKLLPNRQEKFIYIIGAGFYLGMIMDLFRVLGQVLTLAVAFISTALYSWQVSSGPITTTSQQQSFPQVKVATPTARLVASPAASISTYAQPQKRVIISEKPIPWGTTEKLGEHLYRTYVGDDPAMGTPEEILRALNVYRKSHGQGELWSDEKLCILANRRAEEQDKMSNLDGHSGLEGYMNDPKHWEELGISGIGENASYGYRLSGVHLIEWVFDADAEHRQNQLNPAWSLACAGVAGVTVDILFAKR